ncbi:sulfite exporter TauE/SafE family protein [Deinococcus radiophilus]|uniref:sulfite exporter TauE/SafE family protein n=1 Tax=Deinococcus radiophilus TaxID=32062 RepID=UPI001E45D5DC|nr:sulfite exporter TauE/SafE family protein [Deinococcus radiophilus]UFA51365.1 sulfite exporter TauE/SafE family protein [Deinococcus radiophilus]
MLDHFPATETEVLTTLTFMLAALLHGLSGMGFQMVTTSALAGAIPLETVVAMVAVPALLINLSALITAGPGLSFSGWWAVGRRFGALALGCVLGSVLGVWLLQSVPPGPLYWLMAAAIFLFVWLDRRRVVWQFTPSGGLALVFGLSTGLLGGSVNAMAPPVTIYLLASQADKNEVVLGSNLCYVVGTVVQFILLRDQITALPAPQLETLAQATLLALGALWLGVRWRERLSQRRFRRLMLAVLALLGARALFQGWAAL